MMAVSPKDAVFSLNSPLPHGYKSLVAVSERVSEITFEARNAVAAYTKTKNPGKSDLEKIALHAIHLAKLDPIYRAAWLDSEFDVIDAADIEDLIELLRIVPFEDLVDKNLIFLNPGFGNSSRLVGGADADLITGSKLLDVKTISANSMNATDLDQILGYFLLTRRERKTNESFPEIKTLGFYFSRHGHLWTIDSNWYLENELFDKTEEWFSARIEPILKQKKKKAKKKPR
jgi:hypothetical protein